MAYAVPSAAQDVARRSMLRTAVLVIVTVLCTAGFLVLLEAAVSEPGSTPVVPTAPVALPDLPYGGQLELPDPDDSLEPGALMGLGLLVLGLANGLVFAASAALDSVVSPSAAETRRRLRERTGAGAVPGGRREVRRTVRAPAAAPAASTTLAVDHGFAHRSVPVRRALGTIYAVPTEIPLPVQRRPEPAPARRPAPEPAPVPVPRRPSPVPRDGGDGTATATRRGTGPWGWRPTRPDPVPWRNPVPALAGVG
ncbi:hypothetical protein GCM10023200_35780 [Actinomycetospora chlora]|uniref:Uncharacterized protein n=1 Tax=Actinomycetospora chlora TaxID=663608 RepID=A0ABP9BMY0_9PSEU